ncbi:outer membrane lipoprotein carrier protein LolA [Barrientosiimonas marina]|uniref:Outer membrane lipoprotein carrier protein LolA n=1 Tax=Lentibacillus kimchii TaxID=1542911 RepID=A0ABW2UUP9_9BACI
MKRIVGTVVMVFSFMLILAACGEETQEDVNGKLESKLESMEGYKAKAKMTMSTGKEDEEYQIDVWHKKDDLYRVALSNGQDAKGQQIILKNEDGVFVLSPELNKSFKFQEEWPENGSQPYLYQSLVNDIIKDNDAEFESGDNYYRFETETNYQSNNNLPYQEVSFDKESYTPVNVKVMDKDRNTLVQVEFQEFNMDPEFTEDDFKMDKNMAGESNGQTVSGEADTFTVLYPKNMAGSELIEEERTDTENGNRVIMTFSGEKDFTLVEEQQDTVSNMSEPQMVDGEIVNLGHAVGALADNTLEWTHKGMSFVLASEELTREEMIGVAKSVQGKDVK